MRVLEASIAAVWLAIALRYEWPGMPPWQHLYFEVTLPGLATLLLVLELIERREVRRRAVVHRDAALDP